MEPASKKRLIDLMAQRGTAELESFFISLGVGGAFAAPREGWGRQKRINEALMAADREGRLEDVLRAAAAQFGGATATGEPAKTPNRIRLDLQELLDELNAWTTWKYVDIAEDAQRRLNDSLRHLRVHIGADTPGDFHFQDRDYSSTRKTVTENAFDKLRKAVSRTIACVPPAPDLPNPVASTALDRLHPAVQRVSGQLFKDGHAAPAIFEAFKSVNNRVKDASQLTEDGKSLMAKAFRPQNPAIRINAGQTRSDADEQEGFMHIFMGVMQGIRNPKAHDEHAVLDDDRALEYLSLASLLMRRIDDAAEIQDSTAAK
ncbi:MAG: TIGR02391 family protein [Actinomycetota bacterium]|nr:TIGR02391 family protein [Actinomycetota bacterium]